MPFLQEIKRIARHSLVMNGARPESHRLSAVGGGKAAKASPPSRSAFRPLLRVKYGSAANNQLTKINQPILGPEAIFLE